MGNKGKHNNRSTDADAAYLEAIYLLSADSRRVRSVDVARFRKVTKAAVSVRMKNLTQKGYVEMNRQGIRLSVQGMEIARRRIEKHSLFRRLMESIGIDHSNAEELAALASPVLTPDSEQCCSRFLLGA